MPMRCSRSVLIGGVSLACLASVSFAVSADDGGSWVRVAPPAEGFVVEMPSQPERTVKETSTFAGTVEDVSYRAKRGAEVFLATRVDLPGVATFFMSDASLLESIRESFLEKGNGTQKAYVDVTRDGYDGKKLDFTMHKDAGKQDARAEFFIVDGKMLSFTGIVPEGQSLADVDRFLASIDIED
jgi:hypothetical protein